MGRALSSLVIVLFFLGLIAGLHYGIYFLLVKQGNMNIQRIEVTGNSLLPAGDIINASGLSQGIGMFDFSLKEAAMKVAASPLVESVDVKRYPPDKVVISVKERRPVGTLVLGNESYACDKNGFLITKGTVKGMPVISLDYSPVLDGSQIQDSFLNVVLANIGDFQGLGRIKNILIKRNEGVYFIVRDLEGTSFYIGKTLPDQAVLNKVVSIAAKIKADKIKIKYIDVNKENAIGFK